MLHAMTENVLLEIQKTFDFFKATAVVRSHRPDRAERRRVARRRLRRRRSTERFDAPVEIVRSVQEDRVRRRRSSASTDPEAAGADRRGRRRPGAAKGGRPMIRINLLAAERDKATKKARSFGTAAQKIDGRLQLHPDRSRSLVHRLALLALSRDSSALDARDRRARSRKRRACTRSSSRSSSSSSARRSSSSASC